MNEKENRRNHLCFPDEERPLRITTPLVEKAKTCDPTHTPGPETIMLREPEKETIRIHENFYKR